MRALWLPDVLADAGCKVKVVDGFATRGDDSLLVPKVVMFHHTATPETRKGDYPSLAIVRDGRSDLPGPLSQLGVGRSGLWYCIASGKANHAGKGRWAEVTNSRATLGVEVEDAGDGKWSAGQVEAVEQGMAAILKHIKRTPEQGLCGHKEWAIPAGRKVDPAGIDMGDFRREVAARLAGTAAPTTGVKGHMHRTPVLARGSKDQAIKDVQGHLNYAYRDLDVAPLKIDADFGERTYIRLRDWQKRTGGGLKQDGIMDQPDWDRLHEVTGGKRIDENGRGF